MCPRIRCLADGELTLFPKRLLPIDWHHLAIVLALGLSAVATVSSYAQDTKEKAEPSYVRLGDAKLADVIKLTDEQRAKIASLLTARAEALGKAAAADRAQVLAQSEKDLAAVLTDEQKAQFSKAASEVKLRFNFRFQRWEDVLEWYAKQADLSLTLDAPPPGTFNYSDAKEYSPVEAMDLLNGVLSTKGYTLIRSGRMLIVIDLQDGVPEGLIPKVPVEELDKRGKFELVTVMFPLGGRDAQAVKTEVTPLLGQYGKSVLLPQTKQLVVTDTAGIVRAINAVIQSIPEPSSPPEKKSVPPVLGVYPISGADAKVAEEVLTKMFPQAKIAADVKAEQVNAFATPAEQEAIKGVIEKMKDTLTPDKKPRLEVYPVGNEDPVQLRTNLSLVAPTARITYDDRERHMVVFGSQADQDNVKAAIGKLGTSVPVEKSRQMEIYRLSKADAGSTMTLLQGMLPQAKISLDPQTRRLIVVASPDDHKAITAILGQLQSNEPGADTQVLRFYPLENPLPPNAMTALNSLAPKAQISANNEAKQLQVLASANDHDTIKANLEILMKGLPVEKRKLVSYPVSAAQKARFTALFPNLLTEYPDIRMVPESEPGEIGIWARPSQHELLKGVIESLVSDLPDGSKSQLMTHPYRQADPSAAMQTLRTMAPDAKVSLDSTNRNLVVIASPQDHKIVRETIETLQPGDQGPDAPLLRFYPLDGPLPPTTLAVFTRIVPKATVTLDPQGKWLQAVATAADQALVKSTLEDLTKGLPANEKRKLTVYTVTPVQKTRFQSLQPSLVTDFPEVRIVPDSEPTELAIWAKPSEHAVLKGLIESLVTDVPEAEKPSLVSHPIKFADSTTVLTVLRGLVPDAKISVDSLGRNLVAIASPEGHAVIKSTIDKLQSTDMGRDTQVLRFYPLEQQLPASAINAFAKIAPKATVTQDPDGKWLQVVASPPEHELIKSNLEEQFKGMPLTEKRKLKVYTVTPSQRVRFQSIMPSLIADLPEIRVVADSGPNELAIWAKPTQHDTIKGILDELKREIPENDKNQLRSYPLKFADPSIASQVLQNLFPGVKINVDTQTSRLQIWARPADHVEIKQAIEEIDNDKTSEKQDKVSVYPLPDVDLDVAVAMLQQVLPKIRVMKDTKARAIVAWGKKTDHEVIARTLATMKDNADHDSKRRLKVYPAGKINALNMIEVLRVTFPDARLAVDTKTGGLAAMATAAEHEEIQAAVNQMLSQAIGETGRFTAYRLLKTEREVATAVLKQAVPEAGISSGKDPTQLLIWARPADHQIIERVIDQLESESTPNKGFELKIYTVKSAAASVVHPLIGRTIPKATVTLSSDPNRLIIYALPSDHIEVAKIIDQFDAENTPETSIEFYDVQKTDADSALRMVQSVLQKSGTTATVNLIPGTNQLFVEARPEQQQLVASVLARLKNTNDTAFEVFQLDVVDTGAAEGLIRRMFVGTTKPPIVEVDGTLQKLYVRGTKEQLTRVREMLEKMGEGSLAGATNHSGPRFRVIPFTGDSAAAIGEIQKIWSQLRPNELKVVPPAGSNSRVLSPRIGIEMTPEEPETPPAQKSSSQPLNKRYRSKLDIDRKDHKENKEEIKDDEPKKESSSARQKPMIRVASRDVPNPDDTIAQNEVEGTPPAGEKKSNAPVVVLPRDGNVTIMSDDAEALEQLDKLVRALSTPTETGGKTFMVYSLKFAGATSVAETIRQSLRIQSGGAGFRSGASAPTVVADERLNAIVVHANRNDRAAIEKLIETLDSSDIPEALAANRPRRVRVKYGSATQIMDVLRLVYKQQLTTGGGRKEVPIPAGLAPEIAALIQQMNAANTGPLLSLSVDQTSNSIVIMAPRSLADQVEQLIEELDQASVDEEAHSMNIIPTRRMNSTRMQKILNHIMDKSKKRP